MSVPFGPRGDSYVAVMVRFCWGPGWVSQVVMVSKYVSLALLKDWVLPVPWMGILLFRSRCKRPGGQTEAEVGSQTDR